MDADLQHPPEVAAEMVEKALKEDLHIVIASRYVEGGGCEGTELGMKAKSYMEKGELVPDSIILGIIEEAINNEKDFILDGFPRNINQARALDEMLAKKGLDVNYVIFLDVPEEEIIKRIAYRRVCVKCGAVYNLIFNPPKTDGICDICGSKTHSKGGR